MNDLTQNNFIIRMINREKVIDYFNQFHMSH